METILLETDKLVVRKEYASLFEPLTDDEYHDLKEDIRNAE